MAKYKKRSDGRYMAWVSIGIDENGKNKRKAVYAKTIPLLEKKVEDLKLKLYQGIDLTSSNDTFEQWAERWIRLKEKEISNSLMTAYKSAVNQYQPIFQLPISEIKTNDMQEIILTLADKNPTTQKPTAKKTLLRVKSVANQIFNLAYENRVITYNPATAIRIPKGQPESHRRALTEEEQKWIIETPHKAQTAAIIMMYAGLRLGELIPLTWKDIDLEKGTININKSVERVGNKYVIKETTKTNAGIRIIYIPQQLIEYLSDIKIKHTYVCTNAKGNMLTYSAWRRLWESYLYDLNLKYGYKDHQLNNPDKPFKKYSPEKIPMMIPKITPHWLRHTFATILYMAGVDPVDAKDQLGHADITTTLNIYTHLDKKHKQKSVVKINQYLNKSRQKTVSKDEKKP